MGTQSLGHKNSGQEDAIFLTKIFLTNAVVCLLWLLACGLPAAAQDLPDPLEARDFTAAAKAFQDLNHERAEREFGTFVRTWTNSTRRVEAMLFQARARHARTNFTGAIELLTTGLPQSGKLADQYQFWLGEARFEAGQFDKAAEVYALLVRDFTNSPHFLAAAHHEALARFKLGNQRAKVVALLRDPAGAFQRAAKAAPTNDLAVSGTLLLGEALLAGREFPAAEQAARTLEDRRLTPEVDLELDYKDYLFLNVSGGLAALGHTASTSCHNTSENIFCRQVMIKEEKCVIQDKKPMEVLSSIRYSIQFSTKSLLANCCLVYM